MQISSRTLVSSSLCAIMSCSLVLSGCESNAKTGAAVGGAGGSVAGGAAAGATAGAPVAGVGAVVGAGAGALGGAIVGAAKDRTDEQRAAANAASERSPALASAVISGGNADLNNDGFVTTDEIIAMHKAGLPDEEILARSRSTQQIFQLSPEQERMLIDAGLQPKTVKQLRRLNADLADPQNAGVIKP
jgi:hypothetical protein